MHAPIRSTATIVDELPIRREPRAPDASICQRDVSPGQTIRCRRLCRCRTVVGPRQAVVRTQLERPCDLPHPGKQDLEVAFATELCAQARFERQGFDATTLEQIADDADIHKQTVLRYFRTKEDIALAYRIDWLMGFEQGLKDPKRQLDVLSYWRTVVDMAAREVTRRQDLFAYVEFV